VAKETESLKVAAGAAKQPSGNHVSPNPSSKGNSQKLTPLLEGLGERRPEQ